MLLIGFAAATLLATALLALYLWRVPEGPACPRCGAATRTAERPGGAAAWYERWTQAGACPACGWRGRLRPGPEPQRVRRGDPPGGAS